LAAGTHRTGALGFDPGSDDSSPRKAPARHGTPTTPPSTYDDDPPNTIVLDEFENNYQRVNTA
jgi:hypothetical protein